ncbi:MAG: hypothetical protein ABJE79_10725, partial [Marinomonas sp.]
VQELTKTFAIQALAELNKRRASSEEELDEATLQNIALEYLIKVLPMSNLKKKEFSIREDLGFSSDKSPCADLVIFNPWDNPKLENIYTLIEIKRTYERSVEYKKVIQDIARLVVVSRKRGVSTYLFLCGRETNIKKLFKGPVSSFLSTEVSEPDLETKNINLSKYLECDYKKALSSCDVQIINTKLLTPVTLDGYSCFAWRIQSQKEEKIRDKIKFVVIEKI